MPGPSLHLRSWVVQLFSWLARGSIQHPWRVLSTAALVTLAVAPGTLRLKLRTDGQALVPQKAPEVVSDRNLRQQFGIEDQIVVLIRAPGADGIFNASTLQLVRDLTADLQKLPGINPSNVMSLATEPTFHVHPGTLIFQKLLEPPLQTKAELDQLREDIRRIQLYTGTLVATNNQSTAILIGIPEGSDRAQIYARILNAVDLRQRAAASSNLPGTAAGLASTGSVAAEPRGSTDPQDEILVTGAPVAESLLGIHILEDLGVPRAFLGVSTRTREEHVLRLPATFADLRALIAGNVGLVPLAALAMMLVLWLSFRNVPAMLLPLPGVAATLLFVFGAMGWLGVPMYLTTAVMPVLLVATGVTNDIYVFTRYFTLLRENRDRDHVANVQETFDKMVCPITSTSLTTAVGFLSFGFSPLLPVRAFGFCTGAGVLFGLLYSFTVVPAMLQLLNPAWLPGGNLKGPPSTLPEDAKIGSRLADWFARSGVAIVRWRGWIIAGALLLTSLAPFGLHRLVIQDSWTNAFAPNTQFHRATQIVNREFYGMHLLFVSFYAPTTLSGDLGPARVTREGIVFRTNLVENAGVIAGSSITLSCFEPSPAGSNPPPRSVWHSHIEMVGNQSDGILGRLPLADTPTNFWQEIGRSGRIHFELVAHSLVRPEMIRKVGALGDFIRQQRQYAVGGVLSPADYLLTTRFMARPNDPEARHVPEYAGEIKLLWDYYGLARGPNRLHQVVDTNYSHSLTTVFLKDANFIATLNLLAAIRTYARDHLAGIKIDFAGDVAVSQTLIQAIVTTQMQSLLLSVVGIFVVTAILGGSIRWGLYCVLPSALAVLLKLAIMGWCDISLGVATSMFAAMTLGIGVNCAIQLLEGFAQTEAAGAEVPQAISRALALTGPPALINTIAVSLGFGLLMLSQVPANARLGLLVVLGLIECFLVSLLLLPVLLHWWPLRPPPSHLPDP